MTTHKTGAKYLAVRREMGGDEGENVERNTVDRNKRVPPLADGCQCGRGVLIELRNRIRSETVPKLRSAWPLYTNGICDVRRRICHALQLFVQSEDELRNREAFAGVSMRVHGGGMNVKGKVDQRKVVTSPGRRVPQRHFAFLIDQAFSFDCYVKNQKEKGSAVFP
jgi:hypothetical protein